MVENNVLFGTLLALISSFIACVEINFAFLRTTISHFKRRLNLIQFVESLSWRRRRAKCHRSEPRQLKAILGSSSVNKSLVGQRTGGPSHCARYSYSDNEKMPRNRIVAGFAHAY